MKPFYFLLTMFVLTALACSAAQQVGQGAVPAGGVLYLDDFRNPSSGWGALNDAVGVAAYINDSYHIYIKSPNVNLWAHPGQNFTAVRIEADARTVNSPAEDRIGLICRMKDAKNFYYFFISDDGYYGIGKVKDGQWSLLETSQMRPSLAILTGGQTNYLRADCVADLFALYVNGQLVGTAQDADFTSGDVGVLAGSFNQPGVDAYFDNFVVYRP